MPWELLPYIVAVVLLVILERFVRSPLFRGWWGEYRVNFVLAWQLKEPIYTIYRNVTLPTEDGTTQIDHVIVSPFGVFCIETKNMSGAIYGTASDSTWTQKIGGQTHRFQNPLRQNFKHTSVLGELLGLPSDRVHSLIVFVGRASLKKESPNEVVDIWELGSRIKSYSFPVFSDAEVQHINSKISEGRLNPSFATHRAHVAHVKEIVCNKPTRASVPQTPYVSVAVPPLVPNCPKCGQAMVMRTASRGQNTGQHFWGCSGFPRCRSIVSIQP